MKFEKKSAVIYGKKVWYWEKNHQQNPVMVFLHGFPGSHKGLMDLAGNIKGYRLIIPDLPACGQSEPLQKSHSLGNYANWVNDFLGNLSIGNVVVVGHSFGARVGLMFATKHPQKIRGLVLITPVVKVDGLIVRIASFKGIIAKWLPIALRKAWLSSKFYHRMGHMVIFKSSSSKNRRQMLETDYKELENLDVRATIEVFDEFYHSDLVSLAKKMTAKILLVAGDRDKIATISSIKEFAGKLQKGSLQVIKNSGHLVPLERPLTTATVIETWLTNTQ